MRSSAKAAPKARSASRSRAPGEPTATKPSATFAAFYRAVCKVPKGRVCTYGVIATLAGKPRAARQVGFALGALRDPKTKVPWQRVLASKSARHAVITPRGRGFAKRQRELLESEGIRFDARGRVDLRVFGWPATRT